jgi:hypothetical protein
MVMPGSRDSINNRLENSFFRGVCDGVVSAISELMPGICPPASSTLDQADRIVVQYIDSQPARLHESFNKLAGEALRNAWPCH